MVAVGETRPVYLLNTVWIVATIWDPDGKKPQNISLFNNNLGLHKWRDSLVVFFFYSRCSEGHGNEPQGKLTGYILRTFFDLIFALHRRVYSTVLSAFRVSVEKNFTGDSGVIWTHDLLLTSADVLTSRPPSLPDNDRPARIRLDKFWMNKEKLTRAGFYKLIEKGKTF